MVLSNIEILIIDRKTLPGSTGSAPNPRPTPTDIKERPPGQHGREIQSRIAGEVGHPVDNGDEDERFDSRQWNVNQVRRAQGPGWETEGKRKEKKQKLWFVLLFIFGNQHVPQDEKHGLQFFGTPRLQRHKNQLAKGIKT